MSNIKHVAIIMDGNGRWANLRKRPRVWGHVRGSSLVSNIVEKADNLGVKALTLYAFSTENWSRPNKEVQTLFVLLKKFLKKEEKRIIKNKISFKVIGDISGLPDSTKDHIKELEDKTKNFEGLKLSFAFSYGGRAELIDSINKHISENPNQPITDELLAKGMYRPEAGDVDLLIRTGGDCRISNFLLWQIAYAELYFTETLWPDFSTKEFESIIEQVQKRERRFGGLGHSSLEKTSALAKNQKQEIISSKRL